MFTIDQSEASIKFLRSLSSNQRLVSRLSDLSFRYTEVLAGAIDLASLVLPDKTLDSAVDLATRLPLFKNGSSILNLKIKLILILLQVWTICTARVTASGRTERCTRVTASQSEARIILTDQSQARYWCG